MQSVLDILALRMAPTEKFIRLVWIVYLATEVYTWVIVDLVCLSKYLAARAWGSNWDNSLIQELAYVAIVYFILQLAKKFLTENQK